VNQEQGALQEYGDLVKQEITFHYFTTNKKKTPGPHQKEYQPHLINLIKKTNTHHQRLKQNLKQ